jgi:ribosome recycling factor
LTEDERDKGKDEIQTLTKNHEEMIGDLSEKKAKEILEQ